MKIEITRDKEIVYYSVDGRDKLILNFDNLVKLSKELIDSKDEPGFRYEIVSASDLILYKETIEKVFKSVLEDNELLDLLNEEIIEDKTDMINDQEDNIEDSVSEESLS